MATVDFMVGLTIFRDLLWCQGSGSYGSGLFSLAFQGGENVFENSKDTTGFTKICLTKFPACNQVCSNSNGIQTRSPFLKGAHMRSYLSLLACLVLFSGVLRAQSTAQISGTVRDQSGAVLPGVQVTATQTATGLARSAVTDETGLFVLPDLPVGPYKLEAALAGFRTFAQTGIVLQVGSNPIINVALAVGQVSETVEVQADAALVETRNTGVGQVIDNVRVLELPLNARNVQQLIALSGNAVGGGAVGTNRGYPGEVISVGGGLVDGLSYVLDGGTHN